MNLTYEQSVEYANDINEKLKLLVSENKRIPNMNQIDQVLKGILANISEIDKQLTRKKIIY